MDQQSDPQPDEGLQQRSLEPRRQILVVDAWRKFWGGASWNYTMDPFGPRKPRVIGGSFDFYKEMGDERLVNMPTHRLHTLLQEKSLPDSLRDKIKGELAVRRIDVKGKAAAAISGYDTGESSTNTSSLISPVQTEIHQSSEPDHVSIPPAPLKLSVVADHSKCAGTSANASRRGLNDNTQGTTVSKGRGSPESTVQRYPLPHPPLSASRNEQAHLQEANANCRDSHNVGRAGTTVFSSEPAAHYQQSAAYAPTSADIEAGRAGTTVFLSEPTAHYRQPEAYAPSGADIEAGSAGTTVFSSEPTDHYQQSAAYAPSGADIEAGSTGTDVFSSEPTAHYQQPAAYAPSGAYTEAGRAGTTVFSLEPTADYQQSPAYDPTGADIEAGAFTTCSEPPPDTIAIFKEPPAVILIAGAFALLSRNPETFRGPVERVLLGVMTVGFICSFMGLLMGGRRRMARVSYLLQWTAVWAMFVAFFLIMTLLITH